MKRRENLAIWAYLITGGTIIMATASLMLHLLGVA